MKNTPNVLRRSIIPVVGILAVACFPAMSSDFQSGELDIKSVQGTVMYSSDHSTWNDVKPGMTLGKGVELKTGPQSTADLEFDYSGTALRLRPNSLLELTKLDGMVIEESTIIDTRLNLKSGSLVGSQRKLAKPSTFTIMTPNGSATIKGTEYLVASDGAVACFRGEVAVNSFHQGNSVSSKVPAGFSFNPASCQVVATASDKLSSFDRDIQAVRDDADKLKPDWHDSGDDRDCEVSPVKGHHEHDHDHDRDDHGKDHDKDHNHDDGHGDDHGRG
jgi:FecR-like protein